MTSTFAEPAGLTVPDLSDPATFAKEVPHRAFAQIRETPGLYWQPARFGTAHGGFWAVTRLHDIVEIEKDPETFSSRKGIGYPATNQQPNGPMMDNVMQQDPPRHGHLRRAAARGFGPRIVANFEPWIRAIVRETIADVADRAEFDYVEEFARTIPAYVIARVVGMPREDREKIVYWANTLFAGSQDTQGLKEGESSAEHSRATFDEMAGYSMKLQKEKEQHPADDMFTAVGELVTNGTLTQQEFLQWMFVTIAAGFETTHTAIGQSMRMYLEDEQVHERTDRALAEGLSGRVVDEYIRLISPPMHMCRTATRDTVFADTQIRKDDLLVMYYAAANRDTSIFSRPDEFDPWRAEAQTLAFGSGVHRCLGAHLAKLEVSILWEELRAANLNLRLNGEPKRGWSCMINQLTELPVAQV